MVGGDLNNRDLNEAIGDYSDMKILTTEATTGSAYLDVAACNFETELINTKTQAPLESRTDGHASDHNFVSYHFNLKHRHAFEWIRYRVCQISDQSIEKYDRAIKDEDWTVVENCCGSELARRMHEKIERITNLCFPYKTFKIRSTDDPWIDET